MKTDTNGQNCFIKGGLFTSINWFSLVLVIAFCLISAYPIYHLRINHFIAGDHSLHLIEAQKLIVGSTLTPTNWSHPFLQFLIVTITQISQGKLGLNQSLVLILTINQALIGAIVYFWLGKSEQKMWEWWRVGFAVSIPLIAPIIILSFLDQKFYLGYIGLANYHNPTIQLLKPIALICLFLALYGLEHPRCELWIYFVSGLSIIISALIKPNFILAFVPALGLISLHKLVTKQSFDLKLMIFGFAIPSILVLLWQLSVTFQNSEYGYKVIFAPFKVVSLHSDYLFLKFISSSLFIIQGMFIFRKQLLRDQAILLGSITLGLGLIFGYLLAEAGDEILVSGNFMWSSQIALFLMFVILGRKSLRYFVAEGQGKSWQVALSLLSYLAHFVGGIVYYIHCLTTDYFI